MNWVEVVGYVASALVALSFAMRSVVKLRTVSLVGSAIFAVYGALIGAWPVVITNSIIALLNAWRLRVELAPEASSLKVVEIEPDAPFLRDYLAANLTDIHRSQPRITSISPTTTRATSNPRSRRRSRNAFNAPRRAVWPIIVAASLVVDPLGPDSAPSAPDGP